MMVILGDGMLEIRRAGHKWDTSVVFVWGNILHGKTELVVPYMKWARRVPLIMARLDHKGSIPFSLRSLIILVYPPSVLLYSETSGLPYGTGQEGIITNIEF
jgi:hypothetical protein